jgi:PAS domain S-box-containing protein
MEAADMFAWELDFTRGQITWAGNAVTVIGCKPEQLTSDPRSGDFFVHPGDRQRINDEFAKAKTDGQTSFMMNFRGLEPIGERGYWRSFGRFFRDDLGSAERFVGVTQNVAKQRSAETALLTTAERLLTAEAASNAVIYDFDLEQQKYWRGEGLTRLLGWLPTEIAPGEEGWASLRHPDDAKRLQSAHYDSYVRPDDHYALEYRVRHKNGHYLWILDSGRLFRNQQGRVVRIAGASIDITARKTAEEAQNIKSNLIELSFEPIIVWHPKRGIIDWNKGAEQLYGYSRQEALGRPSHDLLRSVHPISLGRLLSLLYRFKSWTGEIGQRAKDGRIVYVDSRHQLIEINGEQLVLETNHDISQRKLNESVEARMAAVANASLDALFGANLDGTIDAWNPAAERLFGYKANEAIGRSLDILSIPGLPSETPNHLRRVQSGEAINPFDTKRRRKDGGIVDVSIAIGPAKASDGRVTSISVIAHDITERKEWETRQGLMNRELAHRVKNSLAVLQSILRATLRSTSNPKDFADVFSGRLHSMAAAQDMVTASDWKFVELGALAQHQLSTVAEIKANRMTISGPAVHLATDHSVPLALILNELATNAIKHGALSIPEGTIRLYWSIEGPQPTRQLLTILWQERGGPVVVKPSQQGFGLTLIKKSLAGANIDLQFQPLGLSCRIEFPLVPSIGAEDM